MTPRFEDERPRSSRIVRRAIRPIRWTVKRALSQPISILVELRWRLGDEIMAIPIYEAIKRRHPRASLSVWCTYPELLEGNPYVDAINPANPNPDAYIFLRDAPRQNFRRAHYADLAGVPCPSTPPRLHLSDWIAPELLPSSTPYIAIAPGASWATKRWPEAHWRALAAALHAQGYATVELGTDHVPIGATVDLVGRTAVAAAARVLHGCRLLVANDSGLMHLALAAGTPVLALFGPTDPSILIRDEPNLHVLTNARPCQGCWNVSLAMTEPGVCPLAISGCMETIAPDSVAQRALAILRKAP